ncbi:CQS_1a_G0027740.mRNA.1.CDS.1 [Saccharomyces cerevisiae]|nr:CQS_1a_G0027740.mRNA.1.CDS.1 [Saccharomyces cerevisiae]CAI7343930.1 CQS_1a_G0027740.mRNA.1.CDS.1 [Saccharomyces cerevisiae]
MIFFFNQIRSIFTALHTSTQQIQLSRRAFFQFLGYLGSCVVISLAAQSKYVQ